MPLPRGVSVCYMYMYVYIICRSRRVGRVFVVECRVCRHLNGSYSSADNPFILIGRILVNRHVRIG